MSDEDLQHAAVEQIREMTAKNWRAEISLDAVAALQLIGELQLALRHPRNDTHAAHFARTTIDGLISMLTASGYEHVAALAKLGDDPRHDSKDDERRS